MKNNSYDDYADWKGWLTEKKFFTVSSDEIKHFNGQFKRINIDVKGKKILDFGYGPGNLLKYFSLNHADISGVEIQESLIDSGKKEGLNVYSSIDEIDSNQKFDIITAIDVLEHMSNVQIQDFVLKAGKFLTDDGVMIFRYPNGDSPASLPAQNGDYTHINAIGMTKLNQLIEPFNLFIYYYDGEYVKPIFFPFNLVRKIFRKLFIKLTGLGNHYFFYCNIVAVVKKQQ